MARQFQCRNCGKCCGPIPLLDWELVEIRRAVRNLPVEERERLKHQKRERLTCPLRDIENRRCAIYEARPLICRQYGHYEGLKCPNNKGVKLKSRKQGYKEFEVASRKGEYLVGILGGNIGWRELEEGENLCLIGMR